METGQYGNGGGFHCMLVLSIENADIDRLSFKCSTYTNNQF
jgi:hypothetical protein